jgi:hypothetical protein
LALGSGAEVDRLAAAVLDLSEPQEMREHRPQMCLAHFLLEL